MPALALLCANRLSPPMPVVSVLMVFHRDTPYLRTAIGSVLNQTCRDLELVLVDNGVGLSAEALGPMSGDRRLRWVRLPQNLGIPAGHNAGIAASTGEFVALLDYDDVALPDRLERQVARLREEPRLGLVSSLAETIDENGAVTGREFALVTAEDQRTYLSFAAPVVTPAYTGRREVFERFPYRAELPYAADFDFLARAAEAYPMAAVPGVLLRYRRHANQTTRTHAVAIEDSRCAIRVATARRRAGREERLAELVAQLGSAGSPAEAVLRWARRNLDEQLYALAAYHARRAAALSMGMPLPGAVSAGLQAMRRARGSERMLAARLFFRGPVRSLRLTPAGKNTGAPAAA